MIFPALLLLSVSGIWPWAEGLRGYPTNFGLVQFDGSTCLSITSVLADGDSTPGVSDLVRSFPQPVPTPMRPQVVFHVWIPSFDEYWSGVNVNGNKVYAGCRLTATYSGSNLDWPAIFIGRDAENRPALMYRVLGGLTPGIPLSQPGWWSLGISFDANGVISFRAVAGRVVPTATDQFASDSTLNPVHFSSVQGWFLQLAVPQGTVGEMDPPLIVGECNLYADVDAHIDLESPTNLTMISSSLVEPWTLQSSDDLMGWSDRGSLTAYEMFADTPAPQRFYRLTHP